MTILLKRWMIADAHYVGRGHFQKGLLCQDVTFTYSSMKDDLYVIALADGAGSAEFSEEGAQIACNTVCDFFIDLDPHITDINRVKKDLFNKIQRSLKRDAHEQKKALKDYASTLVFVVIKGPKVWRGTLGDSVLISYDKHQNASALETTKGQFHNQTVFTTSNNALERFYLDLSDKSQYSGFCLLSDGSSESLIRVSDSMISPAIQKMITWLHTIPTEKVRNNLTSAIEQFIRPKTFDDCSIVVMSEVTQDIEFLREQEDFARTFLSFTENACMQKSVKIRLKVLETFEGKKSLEQLSKELKIHRDHLKYKIKKHLEHIVVLKE